jgi:hypothetical protein
VYGLEAVEAGLDERSAQQMNLTSQGIRFGSIVGPECGFEFGAGDDPARIAQQQLQYAHAAGHQPNRNRANLHFARASIQLQFPGAKDVGYRRAARAPI